MSRLAISCAALTLAITGCATDLRTSGTLSPEDTRIAGRVAEAVQRKCIHYRYAEGATPQKTSGDLKFSAPPQIRRLFTSPTGWAKAEFFGDGVWSNVYYHEASDRIACGDALWQTNTSNAGVVFTEVRPVGAARPASVAIATIRPLAVQWDAQGGLLSGTVRLVEQGRRGTIQVDLPEGRGSCTGAHEMQADGRGVWSVACSNGATASGTFQALGAGKGSTGSGADAKGGKVQFTIGPLQD